MTSVYSIQEQTYDLLSLEEMCRHGLRAAHHSANVVYQDGSFGHEREHLSSEISEPFIVKAYRIHCLPMIWSTKKEDILSVVKNVNIDDVIADVKEHMEYVNFIGYALTTNEYKKQFYIPVKRGLAKKRYNLHCEQMKLKHESRE